MMANVGEMSMGQKARRRVRRDLKGLWVEEVFKGEGSLSP